ncbi:hypothetical protein V8C34DRAFT_317862 [Trichoderma compactum]
MRPTWTFSPCSAQFTLTLTPPPQCFLLVAAARVADLIPRSGNSAWHPEKSGRNASSPAHDGLAWGSKSSNFSSSPKGSPFWIFRSGRRPPSVVRAKTGNRDLHIPNAALASPAKSRL